MTSRLIFPLCLCCAVLCAFVGYMSKRAIKEAEQVTTAVVELDCGMFLEKRPKESTGVLLSDYVFVNRVAAIDTDDDEKWDDVAVALFPKGGFTSKAAYTAVIACFHDVPDLETLEQRLASNELKVNYRVSQQALQPNLHSILARKFNNMDFKNSPVVTVGYGESNPVLGEKSLKFSYRIGAVAVVVGVLSLVFNIFAGLLKSFKLPTRAPKKKIPAKKRNAKKRTAPANYDVEPTGGVLDKVRSMRDQPASE